VVIYYCLVSDVMLTSPIKRRERIRVNYSTTQTGRRRKGAELYLKFPLQC